MNGIPISDVRNFVILGHTGSGKTTLTDALLFKLGMNDRLGSVPGGSSLSDFTDEEKDRKTSIYAASFSLQHKTAGRAMQFFMTDTPGYADFFGQVAAAAHVADAALITVDAVGGIQVGTSRAWKLCDSMHLARGIVVTGLDRENADADKVLESIRAAWGARCVPVNLPAPDGKSVVDVLGTLGSDALGARATEVKGSLVELAAETDDTMIEKYLGGEELSGDEIGHGLRSAVAAGGLVPVFFTRALSGVGVEEVLEGVARLFPTPAEILRKDADGKDINTAPDAPLAALVWRSVNDPFTGHLIYARIFGGTLKAEGEIFNATRHEKERVGGCLRVNGKLSEPVASAGAGDIVALAKLKHTGINQTLCGTATHLKLPPIVFPNAVASFAVRAKTQGDDDKIGTALHRLADDDPTIRVERNADTHEMVMSGLGDVHIEVAVDRMRRRSHVDVILSTPKVPYRETVTGHGEGHYKHKKQSGGRGQYGEVYLRVDPREPSDPEWFVDAVVGGTIPHNFIPAVEKGLAEGLTKGCLASYPVTNVKITVYDGSYHDVDSSEIAFKIAASRALREGMLKAKPVLMEPIMKVDVLIPGQFMGDINGDMNHRRGRILGVSMDGGMEVITAEAPLSEMFRYAAELRSMTGGQGTYTMEFSRYDIVPSNIAQKVIAAAEKHVEEE